MKIAQVVTTDGFAGTERYALNAAGGLAARGHQVVVIGGSPTAMRVELPVGVRWAPGATASEALRSLLRFRDVDVIHSHITKADFVAFASGPVTRAVRLSTRHIDAPRGYGKVARALAPLVRRGLDAEIAVSQYTADALTDSRPDAVLLNGVPTPPERHLNRGCTILVAQRLAEEKRTDIALHAFARSRLADQGWRLTVAGDGDERATLEVLAAQLGIAGDVDFLGWVAEVRNLYDRAGMLLATAPKEFLGLTVLEAAAHGLPVVAAASAGHMETVGALHGAAMFEPGDPSAAAAVLRRLAVDDAGRTDYGERLRAFQRQRFSLDRHVEELEDLYRKALSNRGRL